MRKGHGKCSRRKGIVRGNHRWDKLRRTIDATEDAKARPRKLATYLFFRQRRRWRDGRFIDLPPLCAALASLRPCLLTHSIRVCVSITMCILSSQQPKKAIEAGALEREQCLTLFACFFLGELCGCSVSMTNDRRPSIDSSRCSRLTISSLNMTSQGCSFLWGHFASLCSKAKRQSDDGVGWPLLI